MKKILIILFLAILLTGCMSEKQKVESLHTDSINGVLEGNVQKASYSFSENYVDVSDGGKKTINAEYFNVIFQSEGYKTALQGKDVNELFDLSKREVYTYDELMNTNYKNFGDGTEFKLQQGDIFVYYPMKDGSGINQGFLGIYRMENNKWKIVAGD